MKNNIRKRSVVLRFGLLGWLLYRKRGMKFEAKGYVFKLYSVAFFLVFSLVASVLGFLSVKMWVYCELLLILLSCLYGYWASRFFWKER
ncbi:hypothetical protein JZO86_07930 [Enterococcus ureasiticus]|uniref:hypothetical protein n=1 Tax=Enterococcus ureasiticus TaxID=903984 RepID=UPI001A8E7228|nr:hypothetical protein [Enterococcus ureasiticus]MBO0473630.1 hypothetical protein [Enterococcus ureasiticus]